MLETLGPSRRLFTVGAPLRFAEVVHGPWPRANFPSTLDEVRAAPTGPAQVWRPRISAPPGGVILFIRLFRLAELCYA